MRKKIYAVVILLLLASCTQRSDSLVSTEGIVSDNFAEIESKLEEVSDTDAGYADDKAIVQEKDDSEKTLLNLDESKPEIFNATKLFNSVSDYPKIDGSTALMPLMAKMMEKTCGVSKEESEDRTTCSKTAAAWRNLFHKTADILIVGEMPQTVKWELNYDRYRFGNENEFEPLLYAPIRREGLVFITHVDNPVDSLTTDQLIKIYTGEIDNWKQVGGKNEKIKAYQRNETSGSQANFIKCLMKDIEPQKKEADYYIGDMYSLAEKVKIYENEECAIGYSVYYYINNMILKVNLKLIKVNGIMPTNETIANNTYPLLTESFVAIRKNEPQGTNARKLYNYIRSNKGKEAMLEANYVPIEQ